jgi:hypothetical protein
MGPMINQKSFGAKISAVGFALIILLGNFWILYSVFGRPSPNWLADGLRASALITLLGALSLGIEKLFNLRNSNNDRD